MDDESEESTTESENQRVFDYESLEALNADCIGWICIEDTEIDYPVMQTSDNEYYLHRNFYQEYAACGAIFMDCRNDIERKQEHLILYGHQMKDGSMFKQLNGYKDKAFWEMHPEITLYLKNEKYTYDVAAVFITNAQSSGDYYDYLHSETRNGNTLDSKIDVGVHKDMDIEQEEYCFDICFQEDGASLLMNSREQIITEKLKSFLRFGTRSTRYKDVFDICYLSESVDREKLLRYIQTYIYDDESLPVDNIDEIIRRAERVFKNNTFLKSVEKSKKNWMDISSKEALERDIAFVKSLK